MVYIKQKTLNKLNVNKVSPCATADAIAIAAGPDALDGCLPKGDALAPAWGGVRWTSMNAFGHQPLKKMNLYDSRMWGKPTS